VAAEFLHYFAEDLNFIHADICGGVEFENQTIPVMIRTLFYFVKDFQ
jgi:leucyl aminopeptidase